MTNCFKGHPNEDGQRNCATCGVPLVMPAAGAGASWTRKIAVLGGVPVAAATVTAFAVFAGQGSSRPAQAADMVTPVRPAAGDTGGVRPARATWHPDLVASESTTTTTAPLPLPTTAPTPAVVTTVPATMVTPPAPAAWTAPPAPAPAEAPAVRPAPAEAPAVTPAPGPDGSSDQAGWADRSGSGSHDPDAGHRASGDHPAYPGHWSRDGARSGGFSRSSSR